MKFHRETAQGVNLVRSWGSGYVNLNEERVESSVVVAADTVIHGWQVDRVEDITLDSLACVLELEPEVIVLGTGDVQRFPEIALLARLQEMGIGIEVMDTVAAARTYNVLVGEGRHVVAALFMTTGPVE